MKEPALGAKKIKRILEDSGETKVPCMSTINAILHRHNLITKEASKKATPYVRFEKKEPNEMWQCDFKGNYAAENGVRIHPLSIIDDCTRFCLNADAKLDERLPGTCESFKKTFLEYGMPKIILCDNGNPWGTAQTVGYTRFEIWLMEHGILTIHIRAKHPQSQGKVERFNGSFKQERLKFHVPLDFIDADNQRQEYRDFYNNIRPHHALNLDTPAQHYISSNRKYNDKVKEWDYGDGYELRTIKKTGYLTFHGQGFFLSEGLGEKIIALRPSSKFDGMFNLYFREFKIGQLSLKEKSLISRKIYLRENDPRSIT
jgi:transposase InsO family protein